jgi:sulfite exporter TauE/SafE
MLASLCALAPGSNPALTDGLLVGLFFAGFAGSPMHCVPMCGGFVLGQVAERMAGLPLARLRECQRVRHGMLLPYHLGRLTTYAALGAIAGTGGAGLGQLPWFGLSRSVFLLASASLFIAMVARRLAPSGVVPQLNAAPRAWTRMIARVARRAGGGFPLGVILGFLPCGFLYGALAGSAAFGNAALGAFGMLAFGLGTVPSLAALGIAGHAAGRRWHRSLARLSPAVMLLNAMLLAVLAVRSFTITM